MKRYFASIEFKKQNLNRAKKRLKQRISSIERNRARRKIKLQTDTSYSTTSKTNKPYPRTVRKKMVFKPPAIAPIDFRIIENPNDCITFFRNIRSDDYLNQVKKVKFVTMSLENVTKIDYGTISILTAISDDLKFKGIILQGDFPKNTHCKQFLIDSGFLNHMVDETIKNSLKHKSLI